MVDRQMRRERDKEMRRGEEHDPLIFFPPHLLICEGQYG